MKIAYIYIEGFRGISSGSVRFGDFNVLIGPNNAGKTTVIEALALLFGRDRLVRSLTEHDFYGSTPQPVDRIKIVATLTGFEPNDPASHPTWFRMGRAVPKWMDVESGSISPDRRNETDKLVCQIAFYARFNRVSLEVETVRFFLDDGEQEDPFSDEANIAQVPVGLIRDVGFFLVPASRTWDRMISFGSELFRRAVAYVGGKPAEAVLDERDRLRNPESPLENDEKLRELVADVNNDIASLFGRKTELKLRLTSTDSDGVLEAVIPHFSESDQLPIPSKRHGNGLISFQTLILLMRFGSLRIANGENFLMAIEEPELHVPPQQQRKLLHVMQKLATQTIVTTHSPTVASVPPPHQISLLVNDGGILTAAPLLATPLTRQATSPRRGLFLSDRDATVTALMNPIVIIPEGKTEASWLRRLARIADIAANEPDQVDFTHKVGVIPTKDARIGDVYADLIKVHPKVMCLVDGDAAGRDYCAALAGTDPPCSTIIMWPDGWTIEDAIAWIVAADEAVLTDDDLAGAGLPITAVELGEALRRDGQKSDEVLHALVADAISQREPCCRRAIHLLKVISAIGTGADVPNEWANRSDHENGITKVWTFNDAFNGI